MAEKTFEEEGWEHVGEGGGNLWKLRRGYWVGRKIIDVKIAEDGISLLIKLSDHPQNPGLPPYGNILERDQ